MGFEDGGVLAAGGAQVTPGQCGVAGGEAFGGAGTRGNRGPGRENRGRDERGRSAGAGLYFLRLRTGGKEMVARSVLLQ